MKGVEFRPPFYFGKNINHECTRINTKTEQVKKDYDMNEENKLQ